MVVVGVIAWTVPHTARPLSVYSTIRPAELEVAELVMRCPLMVTRGTAVSTTVLTWPRPNLGLVISISPTGRRASFQDGCRSRQEGNKSQLLEAWHMRAGDGSMVYHQLCL